MDTGLHSLVVPAQFLPAALEIQATPPHPLVRWLSWDLVTLVLVVIVWVATTKVDIVASAEGKIIPSSRVKQIQPLGKGVVKAILVNEGDDIIQGQALFELDATLTAADKSRLQSVLHTITLNLAVNQAPLVQYAPRAKKLYLLFYSITDLEIIRDIIDDFF